jgi:hypothetical protein
MAKKKDIYKIDNYFIRIGFVMLILGGLGFLDPSLWYDVTVSSTSGGQTTYTYENLGGRTIDEMRQEKGDQFVITAWSFPWTRTILVFNGLIIVAIGYFYRSREKKIISVWNALDHSGEARVGDMSLNLGLPREFILKHLKDINAQTNAAFTYDSRSDKIINNKLLTEFLVLVDCVSCGNKINQKVSLDLSNPPRCNYCGTGVPADHLNKLKQEVIQNIQVAAAAPVVSEFSVGIFVVLLIVFWPAAVIYVIKKKVMVSGGVAAVGTQVTEFLKHAKENQPKRFN